MDLMKKVTGVLLIGMLMLVGTTTSFGATENAVTYSEFSEMLVKILDVKLPDGSDKLSAQELYEVQANLLAERGIFLFLDSKSGDVVVGRAMVDVLYDAIHGIGYTKEMPVPGTPIEAYKASDYPTATTKDRPRIPFEEKINYLVEKGYLPEFGMNDVLSQDAIITALNIPELSETVAEAYSTGPDDTTPEVVKKAGVVSPELNRLPPGQAPLPETPGSGIVLSESKTSNSGVIQ